MTLPPFGKGNSPRFASYRHMLGLACFLSSTLARAGVPSTDGVPAQALFDQARQLVSEGRYSEACPKFEESQRIDPGSGTLINLADCYEKQGHSASAWSTFLEAGAAAESAGNAERASVARARAATLEPTLAKITIAVAASDVGPSLLVKRDGVVLGQAQWGVPIPVDEGTHEIIASAPGRETWTKVIMIRGKGAVTNVDVPILKALPAALPTLAFKPALSGGMPASAPTSNQVVVERTQGLSPQRTGALVAAGFGVVGISLGSVFGLQSKSARDKASQYCKGNECWDDRGVELKSDAIAAGNLSTVMFVVGAAGLAGGVVLWFADESPSRPQAPRVGLGLGNVVYTGQF